MEGMGEESCPYPLPDLTQSAMSYSYNFVLGRPKIILGYHKAVDLPWLQRVRLRIVISPRIRSTAQRGNGGIQEKVRADKYLGIGSLSPHSDCKPNIISLSLQKEEKENLYKPR